MLAEVISIGDELTSGQRLDTNSQWLSERLGELGVQVMYHTTVADDLDANRRVFRTAVDRVDLVVATGGLGPTADDLTREAVAKVAGVELVLDQTSLAHIRQLFAHRKRVMPEKNVVQAMFPAGSQPIHNPQGTAPGIDMVIPRSGGGTCRLFALPGVPAEMFEMWKQSVAPAVAGLRGSVRVIRHRRIKCFGVGESDLEAMLPDLIRRGRDPQVGITVSGATITLRITAAGDTPDACFAAMRPTEETIRQCLGSLVFGEEDEELEHAVAKLLRQHGATLATVEFGSGGLLAEWLCAAAGDCYLGGHVLPTESSRHVLQVDRGSFPSTPAALIEAMARACRSSFHADWSLAIGDFPPLAELGKEPGEVFFAVAHEAGVLVRSATFAGHASILKPRAVKQALNFLRLQLLGTS